MDAQSPVRIGLITVILILTTVLAILLFNLVPLVAGVEPAQPRMRIVRSSVTSAVSLQDAGGRAEKRALAWAPDAFLVRVEGSWHVTPGWEQFNVPPIAWGFYYYSPSERSLVAVFINDEVLLWVPPLAVPTVPRSLPGYRPAYGAEGAWLTFRAAGGDLYLRQHPEAQINFRLHTGTDLVPVWTVSAFDEGEYIRILIDPDSGLVLSPED
jgi:hypothetical protein